MIFFADFTTLYRAFLSVAEQLPYLTVTQEERTRSTAPQKKAVRTDLFSPALFSLLGTDCPIVHNHLLCFLHIDREVVVSTPALKMFLLLSVLRLVIVGHSCVVQQTSAFIHSFLLARMVTVLVVVTSSVHFLMYLVTDLAYSSKKKKCGCLSENLPVCALKTVLQPSKQCCITGSSIWPHSGWFFFACLMVFSKGWYTGTNKTKIWSERPTWRCRIDLYAFYMFVYTIFWRMPM